MPDLPTIDQILGDERQWQTRLVGDGPQGELPIDEEQLLSEPSGNLFGMTQNAGMGWRPEDVGLPQYLIVSTQGGLREEDGTPLALGYHTGHWEIGAAGSSGCRDVSFTKDHTVLGHCE